jgi:hypothetical protein
VRSYPSLKGKNAKDLAMRGSAYRHLDLAHKAELAGQAFGCPTADEAVPLRGVSLRALSTVLWATGGLFVIVLYLAM